MAREIRRERLLSAMRGRYDRRLTVVVAGAGFGKTTLLRQMTADALVNPLGIDAIVRCGPDDDDLSVFAAQIRRALNMPALPLTDVAAEAKAIAGAMIAASPTDVCLVIDDLHKLTPGSVSLDLVAGVLERLPATGHLVLLSRTKPELSVARELANGTALMISERDLAFTETEWTQAVRSEGGLDQPTNTPQFMPWPALAVLAASAHDPSIGVDYVWNEVLASLRPELRRLLAFAAAIGGGDAEMLRAVSGPGTDPTSLSDVPLVRVENGGWWPHDLWTEHLDDAFADIVTSDDRKGAQATAAAEHLRRGDYVAAFRLARAAGDEIRWQQVVNEAFAVVPSRVGRDVVLRWADDLATSAPGSSQQLYLEAKRAVEARNLDRALDLLLEARSVAEATGDTIAERNVIVEIALVGLSMERIEVIAGLFPRVEVLAASGLSEAVTLQRMGYGLIDEIGGDFEGAIGHNRSVDEPPGTWLGTMAHYNVARLLMMTGRHREASAEIDRIVNPSDDVSLRANQYDMRVSLLWAQGDLEGFESGLNLGTELAERLDFRHRWVALLQRRGMLEVLLGRPLTIRQPPVERANLLTDDERALEWAFQALNEANYKRALELLDGPVAAISGANATRYHSLAEAARIVARAGLGVAAQPDPAASNAAFPGGYNATRDAALALAALRSHMPEAQGELPSLGSSAGRPEALRAGFVPALRAELAALALARGQNDCAAAIVDGLGPVAAQHLAPLASHQWPQIARAASTLLAEIPNTPRTPIQIRLLGGIDVIGGATEAEPLANLRRSRVKALLGYLATRQTVSRTTLLNDLWPDLDERRALNNFRVTLAYLLAVLEPGRAKTVAPFTVRQTEATAALADDPLICVDVRALFAAADSAKDAQRRGDLDDAFQHHQRVVTLHQGEFLPEFVYEDWAIEVRDRLTTTVASSALAAAEFLVACARTEEAERFAAKALALDPYREAAHRVVIACRMLAGDRLGARRAFDALDAMLVDLGVTAERATEILRSRMRA